MGRADNSVVIPTAGDANERYENTSTIRNGNSFDERGF